MEVTLDIGKNVVNEISDIAKSDGIDFDIAALKILDLGLRVYQSSLEKDAGNTPDPLLMELLNETLKNNYLLKETLGHVFIKERSMLKTYDALSAINVAEKMAKSFISGKKTIQ